MRNHHELITPEIIGAAILAIPALRILGGSLIKKEKANEAERN